MKIHVVVNEVKLNNVDSTNSNFQGKHSFEVVDSCCCQQASDDRESSSGSGTMHPAGSGSEGVSDPHIW